jgi:hypothetical protein
MVKNPKFQLAHHAIFLVALERYSAAATSTAGVPLLILGEELVIKRRHISACAVAASKTKT